MAIDLRYTGRRSGREFTLPVRHAPDKDGDSGGRTPGGNNPCSSSPSAVSIPDGQSVPDLKQAMERRLGHDRQHVSDHDSQPISGRDQEV
jgi:hypothetical protein